MTRLSGFILMMLALAMLLGAPRSVRAGQDYENCTGFVASLPAMLFPVPSA